METHTDRLRGRVLAHRPQSSAEILNHNLTLLLKRWQLIPNPTTNIRIFQIRRRARRF